MSNIKVTLLENSKRFTRESLKKAIDAESDINQWQFAILLIIQAIELALKEKLHREHELLIYANPDNPKHTVSTVQALLRLSRISSFDMKKDDKSMIELAVNWRNRIIHHEFDFSVDILKNGFARLLGFLSNFYLGNFNVNMREYLGDEEWNKVLEIQEYHRELYRRAEDKLSKYTQGVEIWACLMCAGQFVVENDTGMCLLCHYKENIVRCDSCGDKYLAWQANDMFRTINDKSKYVARYCDTCYEEYIGKIDE